jgi:hypothetical protein
MSTTAMKGSSMPPKRLGWWKRKSPVSCRSFSFSGNARVFAFLGARAQRGHDVARGARFRC